jgi:hypothetical protein
MSNWDRDPDYTKKYQEATYLATKELRDTYSKEYKDMLDKHLLKSGIITRRMRSKLLEQIKVGDIVHEFV